MDGPLPRSLGKARMSIQNYDDFIAALLKAGFSMGGGNSGGIYAAVPWSWQEEPPYQTPVRWHTGDPRTDPWEWRMRVLDERKDIAYAKVFFRKSGFITREWYPCFLAARRGGVSVEEAWEDGRISHHARRIYGLVSVHGALPVHAIKQLAGFPKEEKSKVESALVELQMGLYLTMCGRQQKMSVKGEAYGWSSTVFCTTETFWGEEVFKAAAKLDRQQAIDAVRERVRRLNPGADQRKVQKFITG